MTYQQTYLITGVFFQGNTIFGTAIDPNIGIRATIQNLEEFTFFSGIIDTHNDAGQLQDRYGISNLIVTKVDDDSFEFIKNYDQEGHSFVYYFFRTEIGEYIGYWENEKLKMRGLARCNIKSINPKEFFQPGDISEKLENFTSKHTEEFKEEPENKKSEPGGNNDLPF